MVGSEWKRWELHIHTPNTKKNDQFIGKTIQEKWEKYYEDISEYIDKDNPERDIRAIAITDYLSIDNYLKVVDDNKLPNNIELVLPNVEFRLSLRGGKAPINIHCIFNSEIVDHLNYS